MGQVFTLVRNFVIGVVCTLTFDLPPFCPSDVPQPAPPAPPAPPTAPTPTTSPTPSIAPTVTPPTEPTPAPPYSFTTQLEMPASLVPRIQAELDRWEEVIVGDVPDILDLSEFTDVDVGAVLDDDDFTPCQIPASVDDHYICIVAGGIDGEGGVLGFAFAGLIERSSSGIPIVSISKLDEVDAANFNQTIFGNVIRHELGHAVGVVSSQNGCPADDFDNSPEANRRFQELSECDFPIPTNGNAGEPGCGQ